MRLSRASNHPKHSTRKHTLVVHTAMSLVRSQPNTSEYVPLFFFHLSSAVDTVLFEYCKCLDDELREAAVAATNERSTQLIGVTHKAQGLQASLVNYRMTTRHTSPVPTHSIGIHTWPHTIKQCTHAQLIPAQKNAGTLVPYHITTMQGGGCNCNYRSGIQNTVRHKNIRLLTQRPPTAHCGRVPDLTVD